MSRITASARGSASIGSSLRRTVDSPSRWHRRSTSPNRSGCRAARISSALLPGCVVRTRLNARMTASSSPFDVLPATSTSRFGDMRKKRSTRSRPRPGRRRRIERVELQAAGHGDARRVGAELDQPARRLLALHAEAIDVAEHAPDERTDDAIARERARRDAAVDQRRLDAAAPALAQQVRPDLGFDHHEEPRLHQIQRAPHGERPVEREIEHGVDVRHAARASC